MPATFPGQQDVPFVDPKNGKPSRQAMQWLDQNIPLYADGVALIGTVDGTNRVFTLPQAPLPPSSLKVYVGVSASTYQRTTAFTLSGNQVTFTTAPASGSTLIADYRY